MDRRDFLTLAAGALAAPAAAQRTIDLGLPGGVGMRPLTRAYPQKGEMILQRSRPPLLETPMEVFDNHLFTPNNRFFVRWHWADFPTAVDPARVRLAVRGRVARPQTLSLDQLLRMPRVELAAVNQCAGNSRGQFEPRVPGAQWRHGAMGNARWTGVRLRDVLDRAGVQAGAVAVRFGGADRPLADGAPDFLKSIAVDHARDGEVMIAFLQNGEPLPLLNGFPLRLIVPGWFSTYWVKALDDIEVLDRPDDNYWMAKAYRIPTAPRASVAPGSKDFPTTPIGAMVPRAFVTNLTDGARLPWRPTLAVGGIALGGDCGVTKVELSADGRRWTPARLGPDLGRYGFRRFDGTLPAMRGTVTLMARCTNARGITQPLARTWNPSGYQQGGVERVRVTLA